MFGLLELRICSKKLAPRLAPSRAPKTPPTEAVAHFWGRPTTGRRAARRRWRRRLGFPPSFLPRTLSAQNILLGEEGRLYIAIVRSGSKCVCSAERIILKRPLDHLRQGREGSLAALRPDGRRDRRLVSPKVNFSVWIAPIITKLSPK